MGFMRVAVGCDFGVTLSHGGGYPGYGSHVLLMPEHGVGVFALANRTYARPVRRRVGCRGRADQGGASSRTRVLPVSEDLARAYRAVGSIYKAGNVAAGKRSSSR